MDSQINEGEWEEIRHATQRGRLIGQPTFQKRVEAMTGRRLAGEARGWPKKMAATRIGKVPVYSLGQSRETYGVRLQTAGRKLIGWR